MSDKDTAMAAGKKDSCMSDAEMNAKIKAAQSKLPDYLNYSRTYRAEKVKDNSGFTVNPENQAIIKGK